jgi:hypothetical protein
MTTLRSLLLLAVGLAFLVAGWFLVAPHFFTTDWLISARSPWVIGDSSDPFAYSGGKAIRPVTGSATLHIASSGRGTIRLTVESPEPASPLALRGGAIVSRSWDLISPVDGSTELWIATPFHGDSGAGDGRLPGTVARIAGRSSFDLTVDGNRRLTQLPGVWSIAHALRRGDGSIGQQGLVFSPLLRDKTGFSDPDRLELTLLVYENGPGSDLLIHVVFSDVLIEQSPEVH